MIGAKLRNMATSEEIRKVCSEYVTTVEAGDFDATAALFADNAIVDDAVSGVPAIGRPAIRAFYEGLAARARGAFEMMGKVNVRDNTAAFQFKVVIDGQIVGEPIDVMTFDDHGKILWMRSYWGTV